MRASVALFSVNTVYKILLYISDLHVSLLHIALQV